MRLCGPRRCVGRLLGDAASRSELCCLCQATGMALTVLARGLRTCKGYVSRLRADSSQTDGLRGSVSWASSSECQWCRLSDLVVGADGWCSPVADMSDEGPCHFHADCYSGCGVCAGQGTLSMLRNGLRAVARSRGRCRWSRLAVQRSLTSPTCCPAYQCPPHVPAPHGADRGLTIRAGQEITADGESTSGISSTYITNSL